LCQTVSHLVEADFLWLFTMEDGEPEAMQPTTMTCTNGNAPHTRAIPIHRWHCVLGDSHVPAATHFTLGQPSRPLPLSPTRKPPMLHGKPLVPPLVAGRQRMSHTRSDECLALERAPPFVARRSMPQYDSAETHEHVHIRFMKSCTLLNSKSVAEWQQRERSITGSISARALDTYQEIALRRERVHGDTDRTGNFACEKLMQRKSMRLSRSESVPFSTPTSSTTLGSSFASSTPDLWGDWHDSFLRGSCEAGNAEKHGSICEVTQRDARCNNPAF